MNTLKKLIKTLKKKALEKNSDLNYIIPKIWNFANYRKFVEVNSSFIRVNPYEYFIFTLEFILSHKSNNLAGKNKSLALLLNESNNGDWIKDSIIYSLQVRTSTCFDHDLDGNISEKNSFGFNELGTFLKTILLLPYFKHLGVNLLYFLPIMKYSRKYKKGELGSPYSVQNFYQLEPSLFDSLTDNDLTIDEQFSALIEACHYLNIRVALDFIPRTNSRNSDLIISNPEWFYWIKKEKLPNYVAPYIDGIAKLTVPEPKYAKAIYKNNQVQNFLKLFEFDLKSSNKKLWQEILLEFKKGKRDILEIIEEKSGLTTAPAFADVINDPQPSWEDVTYLRLYLDNPVMANKYINKSIAPYILFDVAKSSLNPGKIPNQKLWDLISNIIPTFQKKYGIDGMRIDMGHALPTELTSAIIKKAREFDPSFSFIAEELNNYNALSAKKLGYNAIIGDGFYKEPRYEEFLTHEFVYDANKFPLPLMAMTESHDTPRAISRKDSLIYAKFALVLNMFIPNTIPFINSGQEIFEKQPMNLGLDSTQQELYRLDKSDPQYQKLALFDKYYFHYSNLNYDFVGLIHQTSELRKIILSKKSLPLNFLHMRVPAIGFAYLHDSYSHLIIAHTDMKNSENITVKIDNIRKIFNNHLNIAEIIFSTHEINRTIYSFNFDGSLILWMQPGEIKIIKF